MKKCRITVMRKAEYRDLSERYENPLEHPEEFCQSAWDSLSPFVLTLSHGGSGLYDGWMKDPKSAMISCNDGFRPVSFLIEALDEDAE